MIEVLRVAIEVQSFMEERRWRFCFIGGLAVLRWGEPRLTRDVDVTLLTGFGSEERFVDALLTRFDPQRPDMREFALKYRVVLLRAATGYGIDVALGGLPFEESAVTRSTPYEYAEGISLRTCSAEDLVVMKAFAEREGDWRDVEGIIVRQGEALDWPYIEAQLAPLCDLKESPGILPRLREIRGKFRGETDRPE